MRGIDDVLLCRLRQSVPLTQMMPELALIRHLFCITIVTIKLFS